MKSESRYCVCGGLIGADDHDHDARMKKNRENTQIAIAESVFQQQIAEA